MSETKITKVLTRVLDYDTVYIAKVSHTSNTGTDNSELVEEVVRLSRWLPPNSKDSMIIGQVIRNQTPMMMSFDEAEVEFVAEVLGDSLLRAYDIFAMFTDRDDDEEWEESYEF